MHSFTRTYMMRTQPQPTPKASENGVQAWRNCILVMPMLHRNMYTANDNATLQLFRLKLALAAWTSKID